MSGNNTRRFLVNTLGALGYISILFQWLWSLLPYLPSIIASDAFKLFIVKPAPASTIAGQSAEQSSPLLTIIAVGVTVIVVTISIVVLVRLPVAIGRSGKRVTSKTATLLIPTMTHHIKLTPQKRQRLTARLVFYIKLVASILPVILILPSVWLPISISYNILLVIAASLSLWSLFLFSLQRILASLLKIPIKEVW